MEKILDHDCRKIFDSQKYFQRKNNKSCDNLDVARKSGGLIFVWNVTNVVWHGKCIFSQSGTPGFKIYMGEHESQDDAPLYTWHHNASVT